MKRKILLDSVALLAYLNKDHGFQLVHKALASAECAGEALLVNEIHVGEAYYILHRRIGRERPDYLLDITLPALPVITVPTSLENITAAARIKAEYPMAFADCLAVAAAQSEIAVIMTGDPEFKGVEHLVAIEWPGS